MTTATVNHPRFRQALERWSQRTGTSFSDLAARIGIDPSHLSLIMSGKRGLSMALALALVRETGIAVEKLLSRDELQVLRDFMAIDQERRSV